MTAEEPTDKRQCLTWEILNARTNSHVTSWIQLSCVCEVTCIILGCCMKWQSVNLVICKCRMLDAHSRSTLALYCLYIRGLHILCFTCEIHSFGLNSSPISDVTLFSSSDWLAGSAWTGWGNISVIILAMSCCSTLWDKWKYSDYL